MTEEHWGLFFTEESGETWLVAVRGSEESAIEIAWERVGYQFLDLD
jgi:hypothetical protein